MPGVVTITLSISHTRDTVTHTMEQCFPAHTGVLPSYKTLFMYVLSFSHHQNTMREQVSGGWIGVGGCPHEVTGKHYGYVPTVHRQGSVRRAGGGTASPFPVFASHGSRLNRAISAE